MFKLSILLCLLVNSSLLWSKQDVSLKKLGIKSGLTSREPAPLPGKMSPSPVELSLKKFDESVKADGFSISPNDELLKSIYENRGDVMKSLNEIDFTQPPINAEYRISF